MPAAPVQRRPNRSAQVGWEALDDDAGATAARRTRRWRRVSGRLTSYCTPRGLARGLSWLLRALCGLLLLSIVAAHAADFASLWRARALLARAGDILDEAATAPATATSDHPVSSSSGGAAVDLSGAADATHRSRAVFDEALGLYHRAKVRFRFAAVRLHSWNRFFSPGSALPSARGPPRTVAHQNDAPLPPRRFRPARSMRRSARRSCGCCGCPS